MRTRHYIIAMMSVVTLTANAQNHTPNSANNGAIQSQQMMNSGANYNGAVYEPFSNTTPSEQSAVGAGYSPAKAPSGPRRMEGFDTATEYGRSTESPLGDAMVPLMVMAVAMGAVIAFRRRQAIRAAK